MQKKRLSQLITILSLFVLLVLPTAIVGIGNFSQLVNNAFEKPFVKQDGTFFIKTESSQNITKGGEFSLKITVTAPSKLPLNYAAAFVEYDRTRVSIKSVIPQKANSFSTMEYQNGYLLYPTLMSKPTQYKDLFPENCLENKSCDMNAQPFSTFVFNINGILIGDLAEGQRPIKLSILGAATATSTYNWAEVIHLPQLSVGNYIKNTAPQFTSDPPNLIKENSAYTYQVQTTDQDNDPVTLSLSCPETIFCSKTQQAPEGITIEGNNIMWKTPIARDTPYEITVYANDGKSVTTQTYLLRVIPQDSSYFSCTFTPAISVKILDYTVETPLVIIADSTEQFSSATVSLSRDNTIEKVFEYQFPNAPKSVILDQSSSPALIYQFKQGQYTGKADFITSKGEKFTCELTNPTVSTTDLIKQAVQKTSIQIIDTVSAAVGLTVGTNTSPVFTSDPMAPAGSGGSTPGVSFVYGTAYAFTLQAQDGDGDPMQHVIVTKPGWANVSVTSTNPTGNAASTYSIAFSGTPVLANAGSNLFSVSINDGYGHYITRTWVINVNYPNNDVPYITITDPVSPLTRTQGQGFWLEFAISDRNHVPTLALYYTTNLSGANKVAYDTNISYNIRKMWVSTANIPPGDYYFMLTATDAFNPPATGFQYTPLIRVLEKPKPSPSPSPKPSLSPSPSPSVGPSQSPTPSITITTSPTPTPTATTTPISTVTPTPTTEPSTQPNEILIQVTAPKVNATVKPEDFQIVASFNASQDAELSKDTIVIKIDGTEITQKVTFNPASGKTMTASYKPAVLLEAGIHEISFAAQDTKQKSKEIKVSFTISGDTTPSDMVNFFGINIDKKWYTILVAAIILLVILILLPIIMYFAFRSSDKTSYPPTRSSTPVQPMNQLPQLRNPTASFANTASPQQGPMIQTVRPQQPIPQPTQSGTIPQSTPIPNNYQTPSAQKAISSFVAQANLQSQPKPQVPVQPGQISMKNEVGIPTPVRPEVKPNPAPQQTPPIITVQNPTAPRPVQQVTVNTTPSIPVAQPQPTINQPPGSIQQPIPVSPKPIPQQQAQPASTPSPVAPVSPPITQSAAAPAPTRPTTTPTAPIATQQQTPNNAPRPIPVTISTTPSPKPPTVPGKAPQTPATQSAQPQTVSSTPKPIPVTISTTPTPPKAGPQFTPVPQKPINPPTVPSNTAIPPTTSSPLPPESPTIPTVTK